MSGTLKDAIAEIRDLREHDAIYGTPSNPQSPEEIRKVLWARKPINISQVPTQELVWEVVRRMREGTDV